MYDFEKLGSFYIGKRVDMGSGDTTDELVLYDSKDLTTHAVCVGMTGSGKTGLAIHLAQQFDGEIVGADSMQIYRYMDIGTAKPSAERQRQVPYHMIDVVEPYYDERSVPSELTIR